MKISRLKQATSSRHLAGETIPRQNRTSTFMRKALGRACGGAVDGEAAMPRLDRPVRKRADGGRTTISEDSRREAERLRNEGAQKSTAAGIQGGIGSILSLAPRTGGRVGHVLGKGVGVLNLGAAADSYFGGQRARAEANRIERGEATPGQEDRKHGGKVKKKARS